MNSENLIDNIANRGRTSLADATGQPVTLPVPGEFIGKFLVESELGRGGTGVVYLATDPQSETSRAIKMPFPDNPARDIDRFRVEAKICAHLDHPNIVKVLNVDLYKGVLPWAEMELVKGRTVLEHVAERPLPPPVALGITVLVCRALEYAYTQTFNIDGTVYEKMVHRDVKPANILISGKGDVKLTDFGLAKFEGIDLHTIIGAMPGTVPYMAPEQHRSPVASVRTDIYSLGVTLYEMVTGKRPFPEKGDDAFARLVAAKTEGHYVPPGKTVEKLHPGIDAIVRRCLEPSDRKRYRSYASLRMDAEAVIEDFASIDAEDLVALYSANRKNYRLSVAENGRRRLRIPKKSAVTTLLVALTIATGIIITGKFPEKRIELTNNAAVVTTVPTDSVDREPADSLSAVSAKKAVKSSAGVQRAVASPKPARPPARATKANSPNGDKRSGTATAGSLPDQGSAYAAGVAAWRSGNFTEALSLRNLSPDGLLASQRDSAVIITIESYYRSGLVNEALLYGSENVVNDAAYHLLLARIFDLVDLRTEAAVRYERALNVPARFDPSTAHDRYRLRAAFYRKCYEQSRSVADRETMVRAWRDVLLFACKDREGIGCADARRIVGDVRQE